MDLTLLLLLGLFLFIAFFGLVYLFWGSPGMGRRLYRKMEQPGGTRLFVWKSLLKKPERVLMPLGEMIPRSIEEMTKQERRLIRAGIRRKDATRLFYGAKAALAIALAFALTFVPQVRANPLLQVLLAILFGALLPDLWLANRMRARADRIQLALPNALDLAVVCVEAGLGLDQSMMRIGQEMRKGAPDLSDELNLLTLEINAGRKRSEALRNLASRSNSEDLKSLVAILIQTDRFGTSVAQALRTFADSMRTIRRQRAEERAAKMSIKMLPALIFFIFPAMFIVVMGPAVIALIREMLPALSGQ